MKQCEMKTKKINVDLIKQLEAAWTHFSYLAWLILSDSLLYCLSNWRLKQNKKYSLHVYVYVILSSSLVTFNNTVSCFLFVDDKKFKEAN